MKLTSGNPEKIEDIAFFKDRKIIFWC